MPFANEQLNSTKSLRKDERFYLMGSRSEIIALIFGALLMLVTFGDAHIYWIVGNLDTILGLTFWKTLDIFYPLATIAVFLIYGWAKGGKLRINLMTVLLFASFLTVLLLVDIDDIVKILNITLEPSKTYWITIMCIYPVYSSIAFFLFGKKHETLKALQKTA